jgi:tRNA pseudouridine55 synthase
MTKPITHKIDGILLLDKPLEMSSNSALQKIKRLFAAKKAGHTGSLDPLATGMLPICFGEATKFSQYLLESDKFYRVQGTLGVRTATGDAEGDIIATRSIENITQDRLEQVLQKYKGLIEQVPPMYSAIKVQGQPLYKLARRGIEIERQARNVHIHNLVLNDFTKPTFEMDVHCSKGTYIRTLIDDIGEDLGCGAHVSLLRRTAVSPYLGKPMYTFTDLQAMVDKQDFSALTACLLPMETSVQFLPSVELSTAAVYYLRQGQPVMAPKILSLGLVRLYTASNEFIGIGEMMDDGRVTPRRLLA